MAIGRSKVVIIGAGNVGTALAHHLVICNTCNNLVLINKNAEKAWAEVTDLNHSVGYYDSNIQISVGTYSDCIDADIVVLAVGVPYTEGMTRLDMLENAATVVASITRAVMDSGFHGIFLVITNPVDAMTYLVKSISGLPDSKVMGTGTALDSARLRYFLADLIGVDARSLEAMCMGEHGDSQMIPWSQVTVGAKRIIDILRDSPERFRYVELDSIRKEIAKIAYQIVKQKGATNYGIAAVAARMIKAIIQDENIVMPLSVMPHGEYRLSDLYLGIPAVLNGSGIRELVEYHLTNQEHQALLASAAVLQEANQKVQQLVKW